MDELMDMMTQDGSPSGISDKIKDMLYAKSADKINDHKNSVANSLFSSPEDEARLSEIYIKNLVLKNFILVY